MGTVGVGWLVVRMVCVEAWEQGVAWMRSAWGMCVVRMDAAVELGRLVGVTQAVLAGWDVLVGRAVEWARRVMVTRSVSRVWIARVGLVGG